MIKSSFLTVHIDPVPSDWMQWLSDILSKRPQEDISSVIQAMDYLIGLDPSIQTVCKLSVQSHAHALIRLGIDCDVDAMTLAAVILYPVYEQGILTDDVLNELMPLSVIHLLKGAVRMNVLESSWSGSAKHCPTSIDLDAMRRMLLSMVNDVRMVVVRLLVQLCVLYHFKILDEHEQMNVASCARYLYAPLANRLGMKPLKWQLEDFAFHVLEPEAYRQISNSVNTRRDARQACLDSTLEAMRGCLHQVVQPIEITGRVKHFYSIYKKMNQKSLRFDQLSDTLAIRVIVEDVEACYAVLSQIQSHFEMLDTEFDDYIAAPKSNGYQSIHAAMRVEGDGVVEVQIRTQAMHHFAERGVASHWLYKEQGSGSFNDKVNWLNQLMDWHAECAHQNNFIQCFQDRVFVFTPQGDVKDLSLGATVLDFAYHIHTEVGHRCRGAKVNGKMVSLSTALNNGDRVQIITAKMAEPSRDWLNAKPAVLVTAQARSKVTQWFRRQDHEALWAQAQVILSRVTPTKLTSSELLQLAKSFGQRDVDALMIALARGEITPTALMRRLEAERAPAQNQDSAQTRPKAMASKSLSHQDPRICVEGLSGMLVHLAQCCYPLPGERIMGRVSRRRGVIVHALNCQRIQASGCDADRDLCVEWEAEAHHIKYPAVIGVEVSLLDTATQSIQAWLSVNQITWSQWHRFEASHTLRIMLHIHSVGQLNECLRKLSACKGVIKAYRWTQGGSD